MGFVTSTERFNRSSALVIGPFLGEVLTWSIERFKGTDLFLAYVPPLGYEYILWVLSFVGLALLAPFVSFAIAAACPPIANL
jgi:hypothetical protein